MISLLLARQLKNAGLIWKAKINDFFAIPDRGLETRIFVVSDMMASLDIFRGWTVVTFHGASEWALDYIFAQEVVWMPTEAQLRDTLEEFLLGEVEIVLELKYLPTGYRCTINYASEMHSFNAPDAAEAYGKALLHLLDTSKTSHSSAL